MKKFYVFARDWKGMNEAEMKKEIANGKNFEAFENYEEAENCYNNYVENELDEDETCYIFDGKNIVKEFQ